MWNEKKNNQPTNKQTNKQTNNQTGYKICMYIGLNIICIDNIMYLYKDLIFQFFGDNRTKFSHKFLIIIHCA